MFDFIVIERFWSKVVKPDDGNACWAWTGYHDAKGYGRFSVKRGGKATTIGAHRLAYILAKGSVAQVLDHLCRNPGCCNPEHLEDVSHRENILRGVGPSAINAQKLECDKGHPLSGDNLMVVKVNGKPDARGCRKCRLAATTKWRGGPKTIIRPVVCSKGHPLVAPNLRARSDGARVCKVCFNEWQNARRRAARAILKEQNDAR